MKQSRWRRNEPHRIECSLAKQLFKAGPLEDAMSTPEGERSTGYAADRLAYQILRAVECGSGFGRGTLGVAQPRGMIGDQTRGLEIGAHDRNVAAYIRMKAQGL
jgi:hypothetical protein